MVKSLIIWVQGEKNMKKITKKTMWGNEYTFEVVESVPKGFTIWFVDLLENDGYLPLCEPEKGNQDFVNVNTLKAIKCNQGMKEIMKAVARGYGRLDKAEKYLNKKRDTRGDMVIVSLAVPYLKQLKWD